MAVRFAGRVASIEVEATIEDGEQDRLLRWGGIVGVVGAALMVAAFVVVAALGLPDASDVETLRTYPDIATDRIAEHLLYLGALVLFVLHVVVLARVLRRADAVAALFGAATSLLGLTAMVASALLHLSTAPLSALYEAADPGELAAVEAAWVGAQSVFDTMLVTGTLLVPVGLLLLGVAMRSSPVFTGTVTWLTIGLGAVGTIGGVIAVVDPGSVAAAVSVLGTVVVVLASGAQLLALSRDVEGPSPVGR